MKFSDTIGVYNKAFTDKECQELINRFEEASNKKLTYEGSAGGPKVNKSLKNSIDFNLLNSPNQIDKELSIRVASKLTQYINLYLKNLPYNNVYHHETIVQNNTIYPSLQIQKYNKNKGHYNAWHLEQFCKESSSRIFAFNLYLNKVNEGGETGFLFNQNKNDDFFKIKPETGKLLVFPAGFPYIHKGYTPKSSDKYILTSWLCYIN